MLRAATILALMLTSVEPAQAAKPQTAGGVRHPTRLTVGDSDELMGSLAPNGHDLYFVSDQDSTMGLFVKNLHRGGRRAVFDADADVAAPSVSPNGKELLYISFRSDATGDVCIHSLESGSERCLTDENSTEVYAFWFPDGRSVGAVSRTGIHGDFALRRYPTSPGPHQGQTLVERNLATPAVAPDGRWIAYVPLQRRSRKVGVNFSMRASRSLELRRLGSKEAGLALKLPLPGASAFPAFSPDGRYLYFAQFLNDTNFDGHIDGNDNSVLFRIAFEGGRANPIEKALPEQLTSSEYNCQFPNARSQRLLMTCARGGSLDIYGLPEEGSVPLDWGVARLKAELQVSRNHWEQLLLLGRLISLKAPPAERLASVRKMARLHIELQEYESAAFYLGQVQELAGAESPLDSWARSTLELVRHRKAERRLNDGVLTADFLRAQTRHLERLQAQAQEGPEPVTSMARLARIEILDVIGREKAALAELDRIDIPSLRDPVTLQLAPQIIRPLLGGLGQWSKLSQIYRDLAKNQSLDQLERLAHAQTYVRLLLRGQTREARLARVKTVLEGVEPDSELALAVSLERWLLEIKSRPQDELLKDLFDLYRRNREVERRKVVALSTIRRASEADNEFLMYEIANAWVSWLKRAHPERKYAERLYRDVVLDRAYVETSEERFPQGRSLFYGVTRQTESLEAHIGFVNARLAEGKDDIEKQYKRIFRRTPRHPAARFIVSYTRLKKDHGLVASAEVESGEEAALSQLESVARERPDSLEVHHLRAYTHHLRFLRNGDKQDAVAAHTFYLLALDLAEENPRYTASIHHQLGLIQAAVGNHRLALRHFKQRKAFPFSDPPQRLALYLAEANSFLHSEQLKAAHRAASRALKLVESDSTLVSFRALALDRAALSAYAAGDAPVALKHFQSLHKLLEAPSKTPPSVRTLENRFKAQLGVGASALAAGKTETAIQALGRARALLGSGSFKPQGRGPYAGGSPRFMALIAGLEARAHDASKDLRAATTAMAERRALIQRRIEAEPISEDLLEAASASHHLASYAYRLGQKRAAARHIEEGLRMAERFNDRTGAKLNAAGIQLRRAYAELHLYGKVEAESLGRSPRKLLDEVYQHLCERPNPRWAPERFLFGLYLTMLDTKE